MGKPQFGLIILLIHTFFSEGFWFLGFPQLSKFPHLNKAQKCHPRGIKIHINAFPIHLLFFPRKTPTLEILVLRLLNSTRFLPLFLDDLSTYTKLLRRHTILIFPLYFSFAKVCLRKLCLQNMFIFFLRVPIPPQPQPLAIWPGPQDH